MKKSITFILLAFVFSAHAQIENPVKWEFSAKKIGNKQYELHVTALIEKKWHVYAQDAGEGPAPTVISFAANPLVLMEGKVKETGKLESVFDPNFNSTLRYYSNKVDFVQKIKLKSAVATVVKGTVSFMVCNDRKCLPPKEIPFTVKISAK